MSILDRLGDLHLAWVALIVLMLWFGRWILLKRAHPLAKHAAGICEALAIAGALVFFVIRPFVVQSFFIPSKSMLPTLHVRDHILVNKLIYRFVEPKLGDVIVYKASPGPSGGQRRHFIKRVLAAPGDCLRMTAGRVIVKGAPMNHEAVRSRLFSGGGGGSLKLIDGDAILNGRRLRKAALARKLGAKPDDVRIVPGRVYLNGKPLAERYTAEDPDMDYPILSGRFATPKEIITVDSTGAPCVKIPERRLLAVGDNRNNSYDSRFGGLLDRKDVAGKAALSYWPLGRLGIVR